jgi:hypothetical protein
MIKNNQRMKASRLIILTMLSTGVILGSCDRQLELNPKDSESATVALSTMKGIDAAVVGMYGGMRSASYYGRYEFIYGDLSSDNVYLAKANSNRFIPTFQRTFAAVDGDALGIWTVAYNTISRANNIINSVDNVTATQDEKDFAKGQALFIRALAHFDLVRIFAKPYNQGGGAQEGVPIVLVTDVNATLPRSTVADVYTQVISDLNQAKTLLATTSSSDKVTASKYAASALLSRVYLYKGDYANAITEANTVTSAGYSLVSAAQLPTFYSTVGTSEEIFTLKFVSTESLGSDNLGNMYLKPGYGDVRVSPDLVKVFDTANDARYKNYISPFTNSPLEFQNNKFKSQDGIQGMWSPKILRLSEVILNRAEAYSKSANDVGALADLNQIRTHRGLAALVGVTGAPLLDSILTERRREFMFEGQRVFDLTRNGLAIVRNYCNMPTEVATANCTFAAADPKMIAPIPQAEIDANPSIKGHQNEGY